jgi:hypothetical protein
MFAVDARRGRLLTHGVLCCMAPGACRLRQLRTMTCTATMWLALWEWACRSCSVSRGVCAHSEG